MLTRRMLTGRKLTRRKLTRRKLTRRKLTRLSHPAEYRTQSINRREQKTGIMNPVKALENHGQAVWLDFLARGFILKGELKRLIDEDGVKGVTSNPSIFEKAIGRSHEIARPD